MSTLERAIQIACESHLGQLDKGGAPYILHPLRLMLKMAGNDERIAAVLHDSVEDGEHTLESLGAEGFSAEVLAAVDCLTKRSGEHYDAFVDRIRVNPLACCVKLADIEDNMNLLRLEAVSDEDLGRLRKYHAAHRRLSIDRSG